MREGKLATEKRATTMDTPQAVGSDRHSPMRFQDMWFLEKLALFDRETSANNQTNHPRKVATSGTSAPDN
ncbi:catalase [Pectobacterium brasiliense]|nr:catalase [Pectobacterium brasiliense]OYN50689.1 catalase [Pectobacterium carotovorum]KGA24803.1 catalase [Pectobacterium brasiliense]KRF61768.1 catalase [Pectobacterium brasiliense]MBN3185944.1 catalase [Pectobacterium brasiliense]MBN3191540.1 catalase [Pectobacterium brasiliense]